MSTSVAGWTKTRVKKRALTTITADDVMATGGEVSPKSLRSRRKPNSVYLSSKEQAALEAAAIDADMSVSEFIRIAIRKQLKM